MSGNVQIPHHSRLSDGGKVFADRIEDIVAGVLHLASGHRTPVPESAKDAAPPRVGDYWVKDGETESVVPGAEFVTQHANVPHAYDVPEVSPDAQPGSTTAKGEPHEGQRDPTGQEFTGVGAAVGGSDEEAGKQATPGLRHDEAAPQDFGAGGPKPE
jgi:hypothetical protein